MLLLVVILSSGLIFVLLLALLLFRRKRHHAPPPPCPPPPPPIPCPPSDYKVPDDFGEADLPAALAVRLMGTPANGVPTSAPATAQAAVIWVNGSNEVLVHLDSTQVRILEGMLLVSVDHNWLGHVMRPPAWSFTVWGTFLYLWAGWLYLVAERTLIRGGTATAAA